jgi:hypothetical protein
MRGQSHENIEGQYQSYILKIQIRINLTFSKWEELNIKDQIQREK